MDCDRWNCCLAGEEGGLRAVVNAGYQQSHSLHSEFPTWSKLLIGCLVGIGGDEGAIRLKRELLGLLHELTANTHPSLARYDGH